jgi:CMP-N-acetylneuraminic acid synthetase
MLKKICIVLQARLSSQRIPRKMIKPFAGTTLFDIALSKLQDLAVGGYDCYVSVNEPELKQAAMNHNSRWAYEIWARSEASAACDSDVSLMYEWWDDLKSRYSHVVMFNGCLPFLPAKSILSFCNEFEKSDTDGAFAVMPKKDYFWNEDGEMLNQWPEGQDLLNTKAVEPTFCAAHALYGSRIDWIGEGKFVGSYQKKNDPALIPIKEQECLDIDYDWQFDMCEKLYEAKK